MMSIVPAMAVRANRPAEYAYHLFRAALETFRLRIPELNEGQYLAALDPIPFCRIRGTGFA